MDEITREFSLAKVLQESKVTVYDPVHGEIQFDIYLPFPVNSLETMPRIVPYLTRTGNSITRYIPDVATIKQYYNNYVPTILSTNNASSFYPGNYYIHY
ncbi:uncharacterized protein LOC121376158 isoform X2 [Gigantopelta aegis]|uniref:uncharacterized protein LOC121376158 isoform X2 n=1 Tax=Gigantopelta aegis TaxID=1735272 RepID=UPI001B888FA9|nr:uncharacterized protein LOC121376158 isoform X2 [Gigantopelta aegis]